MSSNPDFDRWYAAQKVRIVLSPSKELETFGDTIVNYSLVSELEDFPDKVRVREGRLEAHKPLVITPREVEVEMEGFSEAARSYFNFLKENDEDFRILRYGYSLKSDNFSEVVLTDSLQAVVERVKLDVRARGDRFSAVLVGVDNPWDVSLIELWRREVWRSAGKNIRELGGKGKLF
ncbi:MAG: hypothetical protein J6W80_06650 [Kiritimatiellae bacterium]|nr:hypothetical protein [Kiritimatiellia bacterium]